MSADLVWYPELPGSWRHVKLKSVIESIESGVSVNAVDVPAENGEVSVLKTSCVYGGEFREGESKVVVDDEVDLVSCPVREGSLVVSRMNTPALVGMAGLVRTSCRNLFLPDRLWQVRFRGCVPSFVHYWTKSAAYRAQVEMACSGTSSSMQNLAQEQFGSFVMPLPPFVDQGGIAEFLDRETAKIDALIAEQESLIALLKEKRQAAISHAVTKGLNPDAPMKPSGIEWLGDVPAHWHVARLKTVSKFVTSGPRGWSDHISESGSLFIQSGDLDDRLGIDFAGAKRVSIEEDAETRRTQLMDGDVLVCITGAKTGNVAVCEQVPEEAHVNQHLCLVRPGSLILPMFLGLALYGRVGQVQFELSQYGLKQGLSLENVLETVVPVPPLQEQAAVVARVVGEVDELDGLSAVANRAVQLLQERRAALISAAVTGQIDVRGM